MSLTPEWIGVVTATAIRYLAGATDETVRNIVLLAMLENRGRIKFNESGTQCNWDVRFKQQDMSPYGDMGQLTFAPNDLLRQLAIDWRGYKSTDQFSEKQTLMNRGTVAIVDRYATQLDYLIDSLREKFGGEFFVDGYAAGNDNRLHGFETFCGAGTVTSVDRVAAPSGTYGGKSTVLGTEGGTWSTTLASGSRPNASLANDWPNGNGTTDYDYLSPKLINYTASTWGTGQTTWADNCERVIRQATIWTTATGGKEGKPDMALLSQDMYYDYLNKQEGKQRIILPYKEAEDLGFNGAVQQEGVGLFHDFWCPAGTGYMFNFDKMEMACLYNQLFFPRGPQYDIKTDSYLMHVGFFGNMRYRPKHFCKLYAAA
jgi:hypothetical protein